MPARLPVLESHLISSLWPENPERIGVAGSINDISPDRVIALRRKSLLEDMQQDIEH